MSQRLPLIVFLAVQAVMIGVWLWSLAPMMSAEADGDASFVSSTMQVWSRSGDAEDAAAPFRVTGDLMTATLCIVGSLLMLVGAWLSFRSGRPIAAAALLAVTLAAAAGCGWFISRQWTGATLFPPGSVNAGWLYTITRTWLIQFYVAFAVLAVFVGLLIAEISTKARPVGFHLAALNWVVVVVLWLSAYLGLYLAPSIGQGA